MGEVERVGSGIRRMREAARAAGVPAPRFETTGFFTITYQKPVEVSGLEAPAAQVTAQVAAFCCEPKSAKEIMAELGLRHWKTFQSNYLLPLLEAGVLERTIPDKPRSRMQRYRTTEAGKAMLKGMGN